MIFFYKRDYFVSKCHTFQEALALEPDPPLFCWEPRLSIKVNPTKALTPEMEIDEREYLFILLQGLISDLLFLSNAAANDTIIECLECLECTGNLLQLHISDDKEWPDCCCIDTLWYKLLWRLLWCASTTTLLGQFLVLTAKTAERNTLTH